MGIPAAFCASDEEWASILEADVPAAMPEEPPYLAYGEINASKPGTVLLEAPGLKWVLLPRGVECDEVRRMWCPSCSEVVPVPLTCDEPTCPRCHYKWAAGESHEMVHQLWWARRQGVPGRIWECIISPPRGAVGTTREAVDRLLRRAYEVGKEHGMSGGSAVVHYEMEESAGEWRPHAHLLGFVDGRWKPGPSREGWTVKFVRVGGEREAVRKKARYEVSHCVRAEGKHAVRWWGSCARNKVHKPTDDELVEMGFERPVVEHHCPKCGTVLEPYDVVDYTSWPAVIIRGHEPPGGDG